MEKLYARLRIISTVLQTTLSGLSAQTSNVIRRDKVPVDVEKVLVVKAICIIEPKGGALGDFETAQ